MDRFLLQATFDKEADAGYVYLTPKELNIKSARTVRLTDDIIIDLDDQGRGDVLDHDQALQVLDILREDAERTYRNYEVMLNDESNSDYDPNKQGVARELARMNLTLNTYTQWYWKTDLHNLLNFLSLRADSHAQYEIRVYAEAILKTVQAWVPNCYEAFCDYRLGSFTMSANMLSVVKRLLSGEDVTQETSNMGSREWQELMNILGR